MQARLGVLALDHGTKRTGFAAADPLRIAVRPLGSVATALVRERVESLLSERDVSTLLVGLPRNVDGSEGPRAGEVRAFAGRLAAWFPALEVVLWDEVLSTKAAEDLMREEGSAGSADRDAWSALVVLRDWLASGEPR